MKKWVNFALDVMLFLIFLSLVLLTLLDADKITLINTKSALILGIVFRIANKIGLYQ